jgi:hypothetical protein
MRKLTILLAVAALAASSTGCVGRCRNWFHKGSPCGTLMTPTAMSAPLTIGAPMAGPIMQQQPAICVEQSPMCVPCDPCMQYDPCASATGVSTGYFGGYLQSAANCDCDPSGATIVPSAAPAGAIPNYVPPPGT